MKVKISRKLSFELDYLTSKSFKLFNVNDNIRVESILFEPYYFQLNPSFNKIRVSSDILVFLSKINPN